MRLIFGLLGALGCLLAAGALETVFSAVRLTQNFDDSTSRVLIMRSETSRRLEQAGGQGGDVQIVLTWNNTNDLDLVCIDPKGEQIWYRHRASRSGGSLDVDSNSGEKPITDRPVENIRWPYGGAPAGHYKVYVDFFGKHGHVETTPFKVTILVKGRSYEVNGVISPGDRQRLVYQFNTTDSNFEIMGLLPAILRAILLTGIWAAAISAEFTLALIGGQMVFFRFHHSKTFLKPEPALILVGWGALFGLIAGAVGQLIFSLLSAYLSIMPVEIARYIGWSVLGGIFGWSIAHRMPNLPLRSALIGGIIGGICGAIAFRASLDFGGGDAGRMEAATLLGFAIGFMILLFVPYVEPEEEIVDLRMNISSLKLRPQRIRPSGTLRPK